MDEIAQDPNQGDRVIEPVIMPENTSILSTLKLGVALHLAGDQPALSIEIPKGCLPMRGPRMQPT